MSLDVRLIQILSLLTFTSVAGAYDYTQRTQSSEVKPAVLENVGITERLGEQIDLDGLSFINEKGESINLRTFVKDGKPLLLSLIYYNCPNLCNLHLNGVAAALKDLDWKAGEKFNFVAISIDPKETPTLAKTKKINYANSIQRPDALTGWHFLTGSAASIEQISKQVGFGFKWDKMTSEWAHSAAAYVITPEGKISRYLYGVTFDPKTIRLSLVEASDGKVGSFIDRFQLMCFSFDPSKNKYTLYAFNLMRIGAVVIILILLVLLLPVWLRERKGVA